MAGWTVCPAGHPAYIQLNPKDHLTRRRIVVVVVHRGGRGHIATVAGCNHLTLEPTRSWWRWNIHVHVSVLVRERSRRSHAISFHRSGGYHGGRPGRFLVERSGVRGVVERLVHIRWEGKKVSWRSERVDPVHIARSDGYRAARANEVLNTSLTSFPHGLLSHAVSRACNMVNGPGGRARHMMNGLGQQAGTVTHSTTSTVNQPASGTGTASRSAVGGIGCTLAGTGQKALATAGSTTITVSTQTPAAASTALQAAQKAGTTAAIAQPGTSPAIAAAGATLHTGHEAKNLALATATTAQIRTNPAVTTAQAASPHSGLGRRLGLSRGHGLARHRYSVPGSGDDRTTTLTLAAQAAGRISQTVAVADVACVG